MIKKVFSGFWKVLTATKGAVGNLLFLAIAVFVLIALFTGEKQTIPESAALVINPMGVVVEQKQIVDPVAAFLSGYETEETETALKDLTDAIEAGAKDPRIKALVLRLDHMQAAGLAKLDDIARSIDRFKQTGKPVYAYSDGYSQAQYYLASMADNVYVNKTSYPVLGGVFMPGFGTYPIYFKSALDNLNIKFNIYKVGTYKSAVEPFLRDNMSDEAKLANTTWLDALWSNYRDHVVDERGLSQESFEQYTNQYDELLSQSNGDSNLVAVHQGLIDDLIDMETWNDTVADVVGADGDNFNAIDFKSYLQMTRPPIPVINPTADKIAVVTTAGVILNGEQPPGDTGSRTAVEMINQARKDDSVKALVLRVDSPGGSVTASEEIRQALLRVQSEGKPVVVSMGSYAASGGYWISANANKIYANKNTLTGSIGTFMTIPTLKNAAGKLGVFSDGVGTTKLSDALNPLGDIPTPFDNILKQSINNTYQRFLSLVAEGRDMTVEQADTLAQGRVWVASTALEHGLIDAIGNLQDAIDSAALLADVSSYEVLYVQQPLSTKDRILNQIMNSSLRTAHSVIGPRTAFIDLANLIPKELKTIVAMSKKPDIYSQCLDCQVTF